MESFTPADQVQLVHARRIVWSMYDGLSQRVIADIKALPEGCRLSGDDSVLANVWEEFKYQVQREQSVLFEVYEETIRGLCAAALNGLNAQQKGLLWLWSDGWLDWWCKCDTENGAIPEGDPNDQAIEAELYNRVCAAASEEALTVDPDVERDQERFEDDQRCNRPEDWASGNGSDSNQGKD